MRTATIAILALLAAGPSTRLGAGHVAAQQTDWSAVQADAVRLLQEYVRIDSSNPPGITTKTADFLTRVLEREGIAVTRYESQPGKAIVLARLTATRPTGAKAILLLHHMGSASCSAGSAIRP